MVLSASGTIWRNCVFLIVRLSGGSAWAMSKSRSVREDSNAKGRER